MKWTVEETAEEDWHYEEYEEDIAGYRQEQVKRETISQHKEERLGKTSLG